MQIASNLNLDQTLLSETPVVMHGKIENYNDFLVNIKKVVKYNFHIRYTSETTEIYTSTYVDFEELKKSLNSDKIGFPTYTDKREKRRTFVIKGLHHVSTDDIKNEIQEFGYEVVVINKMKGT